MKKLTAILITICLILGLAACGSTPASTADPSQTGTESQSASTSASSEAPSGPQETYPLIAEQTDLDAIAAHADHFSFTKGEMTYFFALTFKDYYSYLSYFGVDPAVSMKEQKYDEERTWFDLFMEEARRYANNYLLFAEAARDRGLELSKEDLDEIAAHKAEVETEAASYGWDTDTYMEQLFGTNIGWSVYESVTQKMMLANKGYEAVVAEMKETISEEDILNRYLVGGFNDFGFIDYADINFLDGEGLQEADRKELQEAFSAATDRASYLKAMILFVDKTVDEEKIKEAGSSLLYAEKLLEANTKKKQQYVSGEMMDWAFSEDRKGDVYVQPEAEEGSQHAYLLTAAPYRDESTYVNVRHVLFLTETLGPAEAARAKAEEAYAEWQKGDKTEDSFAALAVSSSEDPGSASNGGLYEEVARGEMKESFENWCFDPARKPGDTGIVDTEYGSHIMYFVSSETGWHMMVREDLMADAYEAAVRKLNSEHPLVFDEAVLESINW